jgi:aspartyl-tRNA(Asn)/glutamyl-tRNA(Gln) amidotransferase subunit C
VPLDIDVEHIARLARLELSAEELDRLRLQLPVILEAAARVGEVAAEDVPPTSHPVPRSNVLRPDVERPTLTQAEALSTAPEVEDGRFRVPMIVGTEE